MKKANSSALTWIVAALVIAAGIVIVIKYSGAPPSENGDTTPLEGGITADDWVKGNSDSSVILVEYADLQCPACASIHPVTQLIVDEYGTHIAYVYRHFPLKSIHQNAEAAAFAAEAAGRQENFFEMTDIIFEKQREWSSSNDAEEIFVGYAEELGLDIEQFKTDMESDEVEDSVDEDLDSAGKAKVNATPTFFLNGEKISPRNHDDFREIIREALDEDSA